MLIQASARNDVALSRSLFARGSNRVLLHELPNGVKLLFTRLALTGPMLNCPSELRSKELADGLLLPRESVRHGLGDTGILLVIEEGDQFPVLIVDETNVIVGVRHLDDVVALLWVLVEPQTLVRLTSALRRVLLALDMLRNLIRVIHTRDRVALKSDVDALRLQDCDCRLKSGDALDRRGLDTCRV